MDRVADHRSQTECHHRPDDIERRFVSVMDAEQFDRAVDDDMEKIRQIAFGDQDLMQRETLQKCGVHQLLEIRITHVAKQRLCADDCPIGWAHGFLPVRALAKNDVCLSRRRTRRLDNYQIEFGFKSNVKQYKYTLTH